MTDDLTPAGAAAVRLALGTVEIKRDLERARSVAVALEQQLARVRAIHAPYFWRVGRTSHEDRRVEGVSDGHKSSSSTKCSHCNGRNWPCPTLAALEADDA